VFIKKMRVRVISDLHLETCEHGHGVPNLGDGDVLILGGDILCARHFKKDGPLHKVYDEFLQKCVKNFDEVLYIAGNHEAYGYNYEGTWNVLAEHLPKGIHILENDFVVIKDWVFLGATLWTDFRNENALEMMEAQNCMNDYKVIRIGSNYRKLNPDDTLKFHKKSKLFLQQKLEEYKDTKTWVLTHHAPSYQSVHPKYRSSGIANGAFVSDLDDLILNNPQIKYFSHGHTHESFDYMIGGCRVVCNPRGYYNGYNNADLNINFDPNFEVEL
jgi:Icc-related predicted phosphoesterase